MNTNSAVNKEPLKFKWSHHSKVHVTFVKFVNRVARYIPWGIKYAVIPRLKRRAYPYCLIEKGDSVMQIGAPLDTMYTGRSRALLFAHMVGPEGAVLIVEPDRLEQCGAWNDKTVLDFFINEEHPATNFTAEARSYDESTMQDYTKVQVPVESVDNILKKNEIRHLKLVSITTNGAEEKILNGMEKAMSTGMIDYVCLARTGDGYHELMDRYGFVLHAYDDRGYSYKRRLDDEVG